MAQQTLINGNRYSFTSLNVTMNGTPITKGVFQSINYDAAQDPGIVQGNQVTIVGRTEGYGVGTGSFEMLVSELDDFFAELFGAGGNSPQPGAPIMAVYFDIMVNYSVNDVDVRTDQLLGCRITKVGSANTQGNNATTKTCDLSIARIFANGIPVFGDPATI